MKFASISPSKVYKIFQHPGLCEFPSNKFYEGKLRTADSPKWMTKTPLGLWTNPKYPYVFCHTEGEEQYLAYTTEEGNEMSRYNSKEIEQVVRNHKFISEELGANVKKQTGFCLFNMCIFRNVYRYHLIMAFYIIENLYKFYKFINI